MSLSLEQSATPAPGLYYIFIFHESAPRGGFRQYWILDEHARIPEKTEYYRGPFKSRWDAAVWALVDLKTRFPEAYARLLSQPSKEPVFIEFGGVKYLKSPGACQGFIHAKMVSAYLRISEFDEATRDIASLCLDGVLVKAPYGLVSDL